MTKQNNYNPGAILHAAVMNENADIPFLEGDRLLKMLIHLQEYGLIVDPAYRFHLDLHGYALSLGSLAAVLPNGHLVHYRQDQDHGPVLELNLDGVDPGIFYVYFDVLGERIPWVSAAAHGKTARPDIRVPAYQLSLRPAIQNIDVYPNALLLGAVKIKENQPPEKLMTVMPPLRELGSHPMGRALLDKTQAYWKDLTAATNEVIRQLRFIPRQSVFIDLLHLAKEIRSFIHNRNSEVRHLDARSCLIHIFYLWSDLAGIFATYLDHKILGIRPGEAMQIIRSRVAARGGYQFDEHFLPIIQECASYRHRQETCHETVAILGAFLDEVLFAWVTLGDSQPITTSGSLNLEPNTY